MKSKQIKIGFCTWSADALVKEYVDLIKKMKSAEISFEWHITRPNFTESATGTLETNDPYIPSIAKKAAFAFSSREDCSWKLVLFQKNWKQEFKMTLSHQANISKSDAEIICDSTLKKEIFRAFREFEPEELI